MTVTPYRPERHDLTGGLLGLMLANPTSDILPCSENVSAYLEIAKGGAERGEPVLVAMDGDRLVGFILWVSMHAGLKLRGRVLHGLGTWVDPEYRRKGVATELRATALTMARLADFSRVIGTAFTEAGEASALANGFKPYGTQVEYVL